MYIVSCIMIRIMRLCALLVLITSGKTQMISDFALPYNQLRSIELLFSCDWRGTFPSALLSYVLLVTSFIAKFLKVGIDS